MKWGANGSWNKGLISNLFAFPYAEVFAGENGGNVTIKIPPAWTPQVFRDVLHLRREGYDIWAVMCAPVISRWGIPLAELAKNYDQFFGWQWANSPDLLSTE
ncbi:MAG: hypothetical protein ACE5OZ_20145 [Candidatus Heimdallarchaeota archaeon]